MQVVKGLPVSPGIAIGEAFVIGREDVRIEKASPRGADEEVARYGTARAAAAGEIRALGAAAGPEGQAILEAHVQLVEDPGVRREIERQIRDEATTAEYAVSTAYGGRAEKMRKMADEYFASRADDIRHVERRILRALLGARREDLRHIAHDVILVAHELSPADTAGLALTGGRIRGLATEVGGKTSHTAIVAREHGLPAIVGAEGILGEVSAGDLLVLDGAAGRVLVNPDTESLQSWREREQAYLSQKEGTRRAVRRVPAETPDGHRILLLANVDGPAEVASAVALGADGVGLFRTEFLV
ncbi:MAG: phosphoenolpyruvate--protein phosphotransferase, partial [Planctomycetales bacterium]|nr:phosphoenolpyruvate--protein phosphotransferase [Planctomycetales bacterium]